MGTDVPIHIRAATPADAEALAGVLGYVIFGGYRDPDPGLEAAANEDHSRSLIRLTWWAAARMAEWQTQRT